MSDHNPCQGGKLAGLACSVETPSDVAVAQLVPETCLSKSDGSMLGSGGFSYP